VILASASHPDLDASEGAYRSSLEIARRQKARSLELRTAVSYARLLERFGRRQEGYGLLKGYLEGLPQGQTAKDVHDARALLQSLATDCSPST